MKLDAVNRLQRLLLVVLLFASPSLSAADITNEKRREMLLGVKRILVVPPFFATNTLRKPEEGEERGKGDQKKKDKPKDLKSAAQFPEYVEQLQKMETRAKTRVSERVIGRTPYVLVSDDAYTEALKSLQMSPYALFANKALMRGNRFPLPTKDTVQKMVQEVKAEAILLCLLDEPRRNGERYAFDPLYGSYYTSPHVQIRAQYHLFHADGTLLHQRVVEVEQPITRLGKREFVFVDWMEALLLNIENYLDELTRFTPPPPKTQ